MVTGGLRRRLIKDNLYLMMNRALEDLGWFDSSIINHPLEFLAEPIENPQEITPNKISLSAEDLYARDWELGSNLEEYGWDIYFDIFTEDESSGLHLSGDIYDILKGKFASIGRTVPHLPVYDLREDHEPLLFYCQIENVETARVREWSRDFNQFWWVVGCKVLDYHDGE